MRDLRQKQSELDTKIKTARARQRYMDNLSKSHEEGTIDEDDKTCILCKCDFIRGYITQWYVLSQGSGCASLSMFFHLARTYTAKTV